MNKSIIEYLRESVKEALDSGKISAFIGFRKVEGIPGKRTVHICEKTEDADTLIYDSFCVHNLTRLLWGKTDYLKRLKKSRQKIGILVKGCDARSIMVSIAENKIDRHDLWIIGVHCAGVIDAMKLRDSLDTDAKKITDDGKSIQLNLIDGSEMKLERNDWLSAKCLHCSTTKPDDFDVLLPDDEPRKSKDNLDLDWVEDYVEKPFTLRKDFIQEHLSRCTMCFACRDACPGCHCNENCVMDKQKLPEPFLHKSHNLKDILTYHFIHFFHLADRCTNCGECTRACPEEIPLVVITEQLKLLQRNAWDFEAGRSAKLASPHSLIKNEEILEG